jgi:hypothetical protein
LIVGPRSVYEIIVTEDLTDLAGVLLEPGVLPAFLADRADLISNQNVPLDWVWSGYTEALRTQMLEGASPENRLQILENCLATFLVTKSVPPGWRPHPAVEFALQQFERETDQFSTKSFYANSLLCVITP